MLLGRGGVAAEHAQRAAVAPAGTATSTCPACHPHVAVVPRCHGAPAVLTHTSLHACPPPPLADFTFTRA